MGEVGNAALLHRAGLLLGCHCGLRLECGDGCTLGPLGETMNCGYCGAVVRQSSTAINRAIKFNKPLFCNKACVGLNRRTNKAVSQKKADKKVYDAAYRKKHLARLKAQKAARFKVTYDPVAAAVERKARMPHHIEYCRQPQYRAYKAKYDLKRRAASWGEFSEAWLTLNELEKEIGTRISRYEIYQQNGTLSKSTQRKREYARITGNA